MTKNNGGAAYPVIGNENTSYVHEGMSLRDYFAAKVMQGMHSSLVNSSDWPTVESMTEMALIAYDQADAMISARGGAQ